MSTLKRTFYVYEGLPSGGARVLYQSNIHFLSGHVQELKVVHEKLHPKNFIHYLLLSIFHNTKQSLTDFSNPTPNDVLIAYHSWLTKSPNILRIFPGKIIYLCQEVLREYYDPIHISRHDFKDNLINLFRYPIKWNDRKNILSARDRLTIISNSRYESKFIQQAYRIKSTVIYPGIDSSKYYQQNTLKKNQVISVGAINKYKNQLFLIEALSRISKNIRPRLLLIANGYDDRYLTQVKNIAGEKGVLLKIKINISRKKLIKCYNESKIFLYAPFSEPFGVVVLEALSSGLPIIGAIDGGGYTEILSKRNGELLTRDPYLWARSISKLLLNKGKIASIGRNNKKYVKNFSENIMNAQLMALIK